MRPVFVSDRVCVRQARHDATLRPLIPTDAPELLRDIRGSISVLRGARHDDRSMAWSLLIVDDHPDFRRAARELLSSVDFVVVGEAAGAVDAIRLATALEPELVLLDIRLPDGDGFAVAESLAELVTRPAVVLTSSQDATVFRDRLTSAPVRGFLPKVDLSVDRLVKLLGGP